MAQMTDEDLKALTDGEMQRALGYDSSRLGMQRQKAMAYYLGEAKHDLAPAEVEGRSSVVSPDVRNTIESMLPQLMVKFCGGDSVVSFEAKKPGDEPKAEQATDYINHLFFVRNEGERVAYDWMKDALLSKNGIVKVWWDTRNEESREEYNALTDVELAQLMDDDEIEVTQQKTYVDEDSEKQRQDAIAQLTQQLQQAQQMGNPQAVQQIGAQLQQVQSAPPPMLFDVVCKRTKEGGRVCVENIPPEEFLISREAKSIETAKFIGHRVARTASELASMGYTGVDKIQSGGEASTSMNMESIERRAFDDETAFGDLEPIGPDQSQRVIWVTECWLRVDYDGDGIAELRRVVRAGDRILENEIIDVAPFVSITPVPMPHKFFGLSIADLAMEAQKIKTSILRGQLDNMYLQINGRYYAVDGKVNLDDLLTSRPGGVVRIKEHGAAGRLDQGMGDSTVGMSMMEYMQGYLEDSTGWTRYNQGSDGDSLNQTATGVNTITNRADMRLDLIARNFAIGFRDLFRLMLKLAAQFQKKEDIVKLRGTWVPVNPRDWRNGFDTTLNVGLGTGNKDQQVQHLLMLNTQQANGLAIGISTPQTIYNGLVELCKALGFKSPDKFFVDPAQSQPQPPKPDPEQIKALAHMQVEQYKATLKAQTDAALKDKDMQLERERMQMQAEVDTNRQRVEAQQQQLKMEQEKELEQFRAELNAQVEQFKAEQQRQTAVEVEQIRAEAQLLSTQVSAQTVVTPAQDIAAEAAMGDGSTTNDT